MDKDIVQIYPVNSQLESISRPTIGQRIIELIITYLLPVPFSNFRFSSFFSIQTAAHRRNCARGQERKNPIQHYQGKNNYSLPRFRALASLPSPREIGRL